jgi:TonB family protein
LHLVQGLSGSASYLSMALAVTRPSNFSRRITAMLDTTINRRRLTRKATLLSASAALLLLLPLASLRLTAEETTGRFRGRITDVAGTPLPIATVIFSNAKTHTRDMTSTDAGGAFQFDALPAGEYQARVVKPGYAEYRAEIEIEAGEELVQNARLTAAAPPEPAPSHASGPPARVAVAGSVQAAAISLKVVPAYPPAAKSAGIQGAVVLDAVIDRDGVPIMLQVRDGANPELARAAVEAVSQWRYRPTLLNGDPVEVQADITVNFTLAP